MKKIKFARKILVLLSIILILYFCTSCDLNNDTAAVSNNKSVDNKILLPAYKNEGTATLWGLIDTKGSFVVNPQYEWIEQYQANGRTRFSINNKYGVLDEQGNVIIKPEFQYIYDYNEGICIAYDGKIYKAFNEQGELLFESQYYVGNFHNGLAWYQVNSEDGNILYGYFNAKGEVVIEPTLNYANNFENNKAVVKDEKGYAVIDNNGNVLYQDEKLTFFELKDDIITVYDEASSKYGYMKLNGEMLINPTFSMANPFINGQAIVSISNDSYEMKYGIIDSSGKYIIEPSYAGITNIGENMYSVFLNC